MLSRERVERADSRMWGVEEIDGGQRMRVRGGETVVVVVVVVVVRAGVVKSEAVSTRTAGGGMVDVIVTEGLRRRIHGVLYCDHDEKCSTAA